MTQTQAGLHVRVLNLIHTHIERHTHTHTHTERHTHAHRETHTHTQRHTHTDTYSYCQLSIWCPYDKILCVNSAKSLTVWPYVHFWTHFEGFKDRCFDEFTQ